MNEFEYNFQAWYNPNVETLQEFYYVLLKKRMNFILIAKIKI